MAAAQCSICGCEIFYVKNPDDAYEIFEFRYEDGKVVWLTEDLEGAPEMTPDTEVYCTICAWHGKFSDIS
ncbi:hypothetical protein LJC71_08090 [Desulfosarcina sp. OttesenSCG-928-A07]|nr:hypothetical protein [Desulfosarcina sp. OttesenSCG-928-A07]